MTLRAACASICRITASLLILLLAVLTLQTRQAEAYAMPERPALESRMIAADGVVAQQRHLIRVQPVHDDPAELAEPGVMRLVWSDGLQKTVVFFLRTAARHTSHHILPPSHGPPAV
ncbi:MAG: hypothetical protein II336_06495 [Loktanella sp.]|nr:hypothetical protein [Loktanella sp.]